MSDDGWKELGRDLNKVGIKIDTNTIKRLYNLGWRKMPERKRIGAIHRDGYILPAQGVTPPPQAKHRLED